MKQFTLFILSLSLLTTFSMWPTWQKTPLMHAAAMGNIQEMQKLIQAGADVTAVFGCDFPHAGKPVLRYAIDSHSLEAVELVLKAGADVKNAITESPLITENTKTNVRNLSLLSHAIRTKAPLSIVKALIKHGADVDGKPKMAGDWSALMVAAYVGYTEAVELLLAAGADKTALNQMDSKTALEYAQEQAHTHIVQLLSTT